MAGVLEAVAPTAASEQAPVAVFKKRGVRAKTNIRKRVESPSDSGSEYSSADEVGQKIKRRRTKGVTATSSSARHTTADGLEATHFAADLSANSIRPTDEATKASNWYDEAATDALSSKNLLGSTRAQPSSANPDSYKGSANYSNFIQKNPNAPSKPAVGPQKAASNVRTITITDFAPDVCKDYKQTGYCGFGDSCKFLHAREDYKQGWELDKDWEIGTKGKKVQGKTVSSRKRDGEEVDEEAEEDKALEGVPFKCVLCKQGYKHPIVTKCGHYFCEKCALDRYRKSPSCAQCGAGTSGVFNVAKNLKRLLERKRERAEKRREKASEAGEEVSDDDDDDND